MLGQEGVLAYLDDLLLHTSNPESHLKLLKLVFQAHQESGIKINTEKTHLFRQEVEYLGHLIWEKGNTLLPSYVNKITEWPLPTTGKELAAFLGFFGYYMDFLPGFATITANLNEVKNKPVLTWSKSMTENFNTLKQMCFVSVDFYPTLLMSLKN